MISKASRLGKIGLLSGFNCCTNQAMNKQVSSIVRGRKLPLFSTARVVVYSINFNDYLSSFWRRLLLL